MTDSQDARRWLILAAVALAQLMIVLDVTVVNIALPSAQADLSFGDDSRQWVITAYALAFGSLLLLGGRISDLVGRKQAFVVGLLGFAGASAVGGAAPSFEVLVGARAVQGAFAALLAPAVLSILTTTFTDPAERAKAFGVYGAIGGSGAAVGLLLGGALTQLLDWRWTMYVNLAFAVPAALAAVRLLDGRRPATRPRIDVPGVLLGVSGLFALVYGFANAELHGWDAPRTIVPLAYSATALAAFVLVERRVAHPLLPLAVVRDRNRGAALLAIGITGLTMFATFLFLTYYLQQTLGFSPIQTGLAFLPMVATVMTTATIASTRLLPRVGPGPLVPAGLALAARRRRLPHRHRRRLLVRGRGAARDHGVRRRVRADHAAVARDGHARGRARRRRCRLGAGEHLAAGRRLTRRGVALDRLRRRGERLRPGRGHTARRRADRSGGARVGRRLLVGGRHPGRGRARDRAAVRPSVLVGPVAVHAEVLARGLFLVALLVALHAEPEQPVQQQDGEAGADEHRPAVPADLTLDGEQHHEAADDEGQRDSVAQGEERHTGMIVAALTAHHRVFPRI